MLNFNHERFVLAAMSNRFARVCLEEAIKYARMRKTFGRRLADHQVHDTLCLASLLPVFAFEFLVSY
jgi:alkylation response protein AidB-like acyl-CoA dehydrogenase